MGQQGDPKRCGTEQPHTYRHATDHRCHQGDPNRRTTISATLSGTEPWTKTGPAILVLGGDNDFTATVTVVEGQLAIQNSASLAGAPPITVRDGAQFGIYASGSYGDPITLNGGVGQLGALFLNKDAATYTLTGPITVDSDPNRGLDGAGDIINLNGAIGGTGDLTLDGGNATKSRPGTRLQPQCQ